MTSTTPSPASPPPRPPPCRIDPGDPAPGHGCADGVEVGRVLDRLLEGVRRPAADLGGRLDARPVLADRARGQEVRHRAPPSRPRSVATIALLTIGTFQARSGSGS